MTARRFIATTAVLAATALAAPIASAQEHGDPAGYVEGEKTLEGRLLAPCCWNQTLDVHESEVTRQLRLEIRQRLAKGESAEMIEADMVSRYGEKIRAVPQGKSLTGMGVWLSILFAAAGIGAVALIVRWVRRGARQKAAAEVAAQAPKKGRDEWDERLDAELRDVED